MKKILITGGTGFIGHYLVKEFINDYEIICIVRPYSKNFIRLEEFKNRIKIVEHDIKDSFNRIFDIIKDVKIILHAGANPSSEDSILNPITTVMDNVIGTMNLLEISRKLDLERFVFYSSAEVFGPIPIGKDSLEDDPYCSASPYAASKAAGGELAISYSNSFGIPVSIIYVNNTFGPMSQSNRFPVIVIDKLLRNETINIHSGPKNTIGGRRWFFVGNVASHTRFVLDNQKNLCEKWCSAGKKFINNLEFAETIANILGKEFKYNLIPVDRPGHDLCYSIDPKKFYMLGWKEPKSFEDNVLETIEWYKNNLEWLKRN